MNNNLDTVNKNNNYRTSKNINFTDQNIETNKQFCEKRRKCQITPKNYKVMNLEKEYKKDKNYNSNNKINYDDILIDILRSIILFLFCFLFILLVVFIFKCKNKLDGLKFLKSLFE